MRVISGSARGCRLYSVEGLSTRPTSDKLKEALFSMILPDLGGSTFLDLFSGTGAIGIEALSRGAEKAVFVDNSRQCGKVIYANLERTKLLNKARIVTADYISALSSLAGQTFDIIFADPPYHKDIAKTAIMYVMKNKLLAGNGYIVIEQASDDNPLEIEMLEIFKIKKYKTASFIFYKMIVDERSASDLTDIASTDTEG